MLLRLAILGIFLGSGFLSMPEAIAQGNQTGNKTANTKTKARRYIPRKRPAPKGTVTTTATRGCSVGEASQGKFVALAPVTAIGLTKSTHPTFSWYIPSKTSYKLRFEIALANTQFESILYQTKLDSQPGVMQLTLPKSQAGLAVGQTYNWRVILECEPGRPSADQLVGGELEVVVDAGLQTYIEEELWYDTFAIATPQERKQLLQDLAALEAEDPADKIIQQSNSLQQVIQLAPTAN